MIKSFKCRDTEALFNQKRVAGFQAFENFARRKLIYLDDCENLAEIACIPGLALESLSGNRQGQRSIRINKQWRICFSWTKEGAEDVEIVDYH